MNRTPYGDGSVFQRTSDGQWVANYMEGGKRKATYGRTRAEAVRKRRDAKERLAKGMVPRDARRTFEQEANRWIETTSLTHNLTPASRRVYVDVLNLHVIPEIGSSPIGSLKPSDVSRVLVSMQEKNLSPSYRHQVHKAISHVYKMAIADGLVSSNPTRLVPAPRGAVRKRVVPARETVRRMINEAGDARLRIFIVIAAHTGLRIAEILSLEWSSINVSTASIAVTGKGGKKRAVFLTPTLKSELDAWRKQQAKQRLASRWWDTEHEWIITTEIGTKMDAQNWRRKYFKPLADRIAPGATPHSLRHAFATIMLEETVPMRVVSEQMGHSSTRITEQAYSHVTARLQQEAGAAVERALGM